MYLFRISNYDEALCTETAELLSKRLEAESRRRLPAVWKLTDGAAAYAAAGPGRERRAPRYRVYGAVLLALGVFVLVPGLMEPQSPALIAAGAAALLAGAVEFALAGKRKAATPQKSCRKDAQKLLQNLCAADFEQNPTEIAFDDSGMTVRADGRINKNRMAAQIFLDKSLLKKVNDIVHPAVRTYLEQEVKKAAEEGKTDLFFIEAALLIENGYKDFVDEMWYVYASPEVRRRRLKVNRGYSDEKITGIMGNQLTEEQYRKNSDFVIDNSDSLGAACEQIKNRLEAYTWQE